MIRGNQATSFSGEPVGDKLSPARPRVCVSGGKSGSRRDLGALSWRSALAGGRVPKAEPPEPPVCLCPGGNIPSP